MTRDIGPGNTTTEWIFKSVAIEGDQKEIRIYLFQTDPIPIILLVFITYNGPAIVPGSSNIKTNMTVSAQGLLSSGVHEQTDSCKTVVQVP